MLQPVRVAGLHIVFASCIQIALVVSQDLLLSMCLAPTLRILPAP
jgi:hypothetical protein